MDSEVIAVDVVGSFVVVVWLRSCIVVSAVVLY